MYLHLDSDFKIHVSRHAINYITLDDIEAHASYEAAMQQVVEDEKREKETMIVNRVD